MPAPFPHSRPAPRGPLVRLAVILLAAGLLGACSGNGLPDFPPYPPASRYLARQAQWQAERDRPPPLQWRVRQRDLDAFQRLDRRIVAAQAERARIMALRQQAVNHRWEQSRDDWARYKASWAGRAQRAEAFHEQRLANQARSRRLLAERYQGYQGRLDALMRQQRERERLRERNTPWGVP